MKHINSQLKLRRKSTCMIFRLFGNTWKTHLFSVRRQYDDDLWKFLEYYRRFSLVSVSLFLVLRLFQYSSWMRWAQNIKFDRDDLNKYSYYYNTKFLVILIQNYQLCAIICYIIKYSIGCTRFSGKKFTTYERKNLFSGNFSKPDGWTRLEILVDDATHS